MADELIFKICLASIVLIIVCIELFIINRIIKTYLNNKITVEKDRLIKDTDPDRKKILDQLDDLIKEILDEYVIFNITPKDVYYINTTMEKEIVDYVTLSVPERMSSLLLKKLELIYNYDYIGELIGHRSYFIIVDFILVFNTDKAKEESK